MCRFLLIKFNTTIKPTKVLTEFAKMCKGSKTLDGNRQRDGYGICYLKDGRWELVKSLSPIWENIALLDMLPETKLLVAHARSATFSSEIGVLEYNQPYLSNDREYVFVFNGLIKGVFLKEEASGKIGAQKIWSLINKRIKAYTDVKKAVQETYDLIRCSSKEVVGFNVGVASKNSIFSFFNPENKQNYFNLYLDKTHDYEIICSEKIKVM